MSAAPCAGSHLTGSSRRLQCRMAVCLPARRPARHRPLALTRTRDTHRGNGRTHLVIYRTIHLHIRTAVRDHLLHNISRNCITRFHAPESPEHVHSSQEKSTWTICQPRSDDKLRNLLDDLRYLPPEFMWEICSCRSAGR